MIQFKSRREYVLIACIICGLYFIGWSIFITKLHSIKLTTLWTVYAMTLTSLLAFLFWPKNNEPTHSRMLCLGIVIPAVVLFIVGITFETIYPGWPDSMESSEPRYLIDIVGNGIIFLFYFSYITALTPYILGVFISMKFVCYR